MSASAHALGIPVLICAAMSISLRQGLSFCRVGDRWLFLDCERDRYFRLNDRLDSALTTLVRGEALNRALVQAFVDHDILRETPPQNGGAIRPIMIDVPNRSAIEDAGCLPNESGLAVITEVHWLLMKARIGLKRNKLSAILGRNERLSAASSDRNEKEAVASAVQFYRARRLFPAPVMCLPDSLAMIEFLARRTYRAWLVFGVRLNPFRAHCWVQTQRYLLNEISDVAARFTPILAVE